MSSILNDLGIAGLFAGTCGAIAGAIALPYHLFAAVVAIAFILALGHLVRDATFWPLAAAVLVNAIAGLVFPRAFPEEPFLEYLAPMITVVAAFGVAAAVLRRLAWREPSPPSAADTSLEA